MGVLFGQNAADSLQNRGVSPQGNAREPLGIGQPLLPPGQGDPGADVFSQGMQGLIRQEPVTNILQLLEFLGIMEKDRQKSASPPKKSR